jgi:hypothetical protein
MVGLDIRWPIGLLFVIFGVLLAGFGVTSDPAIYRASLGVNVNLWWGGVMLAFGLVMVMLAVRGDRKRASHDADAGNPASTR